VDLIREQLVAKYGDDELNREGYRVYTTIDPPLQKVAADAVDVGLKEADAAIKKLRTRKVKVGKKYETKVLPGPQAQVALVALDPHTGEVLALVGGRNYGWSQLDHAVAKRPTGSIFKPFVFATAVNNAIINEQPVFTPATLVDDSPTAFINGDDVYTPRNFEEKYFGQVTAQKALDLSLNNATVKVAEMVGYDKVAALAKAAGITSVKATPAMALGSYDATPMEMASAYTVFANGGTRINPIMLKSVRDPNGDVVDNFQPQKSQVLDPRVAFVITKMLEGVLNNGTAVGVRARGFTAPAAGKTGSSHDAWFAGYTSNLLCVVWVGYDDYSDVKLTGAALALPIWTEFMKRAISLPEYSDAGPFTPPQGVVQVTLDKATNEIATPACPDDYTTAFIDGTQPTQTCEQSASQSHGNFFQRILGMEPKPASPPSNTNGSSVQPQGQYPTANRGAAAPTPEPEKKKGFWGRLFGGGNDKKDDNKDNKPAANGPGNRPPQ
jgi:penicillin-binding protein 1B